MTDINELLEAATDRPVRPIDVDRVVRRGKRRKRARVALVASIVVLAVLGAGWGTQQLRTSIAPEIVDHPDGTEALDDLGVPVLVGSELYGVEGAPYGLHGPSEVHGPSTDDVVMSPDGRAVAYTSTRHGGLEYGDTVTPSVRVLDLETGEDRVVAEGASYVAWRDDGALATVVGGSHEVGEPNYIGQVVVIHDGQRETWTDEPASYDIAAWAGNRLIVDRAFLGPEGDVDEEMLVLDGPNEIRTIGEPGRNSVIDVSPDGRRVLMHWGPEEGGSLGQLHLVDVATGELDARSSPITVDNRISGPGEWRDDRVVMGSDDGRVVELQITADSIELVRTIELMPGSDVEQGPYDVTYTDSGIVALLGKTSFEGPGAPTTDTALVRCPTDEPCDQIGVRADIVHLVGTTTFASGDLDR